MKLLIVFAFLSVPFWSFSLDGSMSNLQNTRIPSAKNAIHLQLLDIAGDSYALKYERALTEWFSIGLGGMYSPNFFWLTGESLWNAELSLRLYFGGLLIGLFPQIPKDIVRYVDADAVGGFFMEIAGSYGRQVPGFSYQFSSMNGVSRYYTSTSVGIVPSAALRLGDKILFGDGNGFFLDISAGVRGYFGNIQTFVDNNGLKSTISTSFAFGISLSIAAGIAF